jgi:hypothetical protein
MKEDLYFNSLSKTQASALKKRTSLKFSKCSANSMPLPVLTHLGSDWDYQLAKRSQRLYMEKYLLSKMKKLVWIQYSSPAT